MKLELCVTDYAGILLAKKHRLDRIELCANLGQGGTTPSHGLVQLALQHIETHVLIRPRVGGFVYDGLEKETLLAEIHQLSKLPVAGLVVGALDANKQIDETLLTDVRKLVKDRVLTFHRAFDEMEDWEAGVEVLKRLRFSRVLTSGRADDVDAGFNSFRKLKEVFADDLELMPGGGIHCQNILRIAEEVQPAAIHFSATSKMPREDSRFATDSLCVAENKLTEILNAVRPVR
ncbi:MAG: copper homeostasis protein CutC [Pirellulaceae bacterium]